jgi:hypothetical protein
MARLSRPDSESLADLFAVVAQRILRIVILTLSKTLGVFADPKYGRPAAPIEGISGVVTKDGDGDGRRVVDSLLERLDTYGLGRRQFVKLLAGSAAALAAAGTLTTVGRRDAAHTGAVA